MSSFKNKHNSFKSSAQTISALVGRLPLSRQMNATQAMLVKLTPAWLSWAKNNLPPEYLNSTQLVSINNNGNKPAELSIACANANCATQLKHQQSSLLNAFHAEGFSNIQQLKIRLALPNNTTLNNNTTPRNTATNNAPTNNQSIKHNSGRSEQSKQRHLPSRTSITLIESCRKGVSNEHLSTSLARLSETLKKSRPD